MNGASGAVAPNLPPLSSLIKPDQVHKLPNFPEESKQKYHQGITRLWEQINANPEHSANWLQAYRKLYEVSMGIKKSIQDKKAAAVTASQGDVRPTSQQGSTDAKPPTQAGATQPPQPGYSQALLQKVEELEVAVPSNIAATQGPDATQRYIMEAKKKYAHALHRYEQAEASIKRMHQVVAQRNSEGKPLSGTEQQQFQGQHAQLKSRVQESKDFINEFRSQQQRVKSSNGDDSSMQAVKQEVKPGMNILSQQPEHQGQAHTVSSALDAARSQGNLPGRTSGISPPNNGQITQPPVTNDKDPTSQQSVPSHTQNQFADVKTEGQTDGHNSSSNNARPGSPRTLDQAAAMEKARSFPNPNPSAQYPMNASQVTGHGHPPSQHMQRDPMSHNSSRMNVPKELNIPAPQPVGMSQSRPTMTNGPHAMGPLGQPAIQRHPGYILEGDGDRVLSKKKLQELVKQVTGGGGPDGDDGETMSADVEETLLDVCDDFVDQVISSACKLAKLRSSATLEIRDVQLILERNYNIRIPGYASDELRTVKKIQPAPGWTQKLSAVNAAKVTGGKGE